MLKRILSILSYVGIALVFGALAIRILRPEWDQYAVYASWAGLALVVLYTIGQWREIATFFQRRNARYGTLVVEYMGRRERVTSDSEQDLTNALIKVLNPQEKRVYFLAGHGEKDPN